MFKNPYFLYGFYPKVNAHERQSGVNKGVMCLRRADVTTLGVISGPGAIQKTQVSNRLNATRIYMNSVLYCLPDTGLFQI